MRNPAYSERSRTLAEEANAALQAQRALIELRAGRDILIVDGDERLSIAALEAIDEQALASGTPVGGSVQLLISRPRAQALDRSIDAEALRVTLPARRPPPSESEASKRFAWRVAGIDDPAAPVEGLERCRFEQRRGRTARAALELVRQARLQPAAVIRSTSVSSEPLDPFCIEAGDALAYPVLRGRLIDRTGSARVQLHAIPDAMFHAFRERFGDAEHVAVVVGSPDLSAPVTVRLHSACFTGDLFGSLRCDCGEQLEGAIDTLSRNGGGVILYLDQEGRGIGLGNKLRAYRMQADGLDTIEADRRLGFGADGRDFTAARAMLQQLGIARVRLLTNNPAKVEALNGDAVQVTERLPLSGSINPHNARYLKTKRDRGGHLPSILDGRVRDA